MSRRMKTIRVAGVFILSFAIMLCVFGDSAFEANAETLGVNKQVDYIMQAEDHQEVSLSQINRLFPGMLLDESGIARGVKTRTLNTTEKQVIIERSADYQNGKCQLKVYNDGSYEVFGYEKANPEVMRSDGTGYYLSGDVYYSYYTMGFSSFNYNYKTHLNASTGYSVISDMSSMTSVPGTNFIGYFSSGSVVCNRWMQSGSLPAKMTGYAQYNTVNGNSTIPGPIFSLFTEILYGNITVTFTAG